jgi:hypothetical protein
MPLVKWRLVSIKSKKAKMDLGLPTHCCPVKIRNRIKMAIPFNESRFEMSFKNKAPLI